jgi:hypothetical protein
MNALKLFLTFVLTFIISGLIIGLILSRFDVFRKCDFSYQNIKVDQNFDNEFIPPEGSEILSKSIKSEKKDFFKKSKINWNKLLYYTIPLALFTSFFFCILESRKKKEKPLWNPDKTF